MVILIKFLPSRPRTLLLYLGSTDFTPVLRGPKQNHHQPQPTPMWRTQHYPDYERDGSLLIVQELKKGRLPLVLIWGYIEVNKKDKLFSVFSSRVPRGPEMGTLPMAGLCNGIPFF